MLEWHIFLKVAKKLEKLENRENRNVDSDEEDDFDCDQGDYPSIDSFRWELFRIFLWCIKETVKCYFTYLVLKVGSPLSPFGHKTEKSSKNAKNGVLRQKRNVFCASKTMD